MPTTYAVVGASRGIGLEYVRQLSTKPDTTVFAVVRDKQNSPHAVSLAAGAKNVHVIEGDVTKHRSMAAAAKEISEISGGKLDYLIHSAARMNPSSLLRSIQDFASLDELDADFTEAFQVNTLGIVHTVEALLPLLRAGTAKKIVVINTPGASYGFVRKVGVKSLDAYCVSKSATIMLTVKYALHLAPEGITVVTLSPGHVDTSATASEKPDPEQARRAGFDYDRQSPAESIEKQLKVIDGITPADSGKLLSHEGGEYFSE